MPKYINFTHTVWNYYCADTKLHKIKTFGKALKYKVQPSQWFIFKSYMIKTYTESRFSTFSSPSSPNHRNECGWKWLWFEVHVINFIQWTYFPLQPQNSQKMFSLPKIWLKRKLKLTANDFSQRLKGVRSINGNPMPWQSKCATILHREGCMCVWVSFCFIWFFLKMSSNGTKPFKLAFTKNARWAITWYTLFFI